MADVTLSNPYKGLGGAENDAKAWAYDKFHDILGRDPTTSELAQVTPIFQGSDPHITDVAAGTNWISALANSPDAVYKRQQDEYGKNAPQNYGTVDQQFQGLLGRGATQEEKDHFGKLLASGQVDQYQLQDFLKQQPEYTSKQDASFRSGLTNELAGADSQYFNEQIMPGIQSNFAKQGRTVDSSGFKNALGQAAQGQNIERQKYIAQLSASQYSGRQDQAYGDYQNYMQNTQARNNQSLTAPIARQNEITDYTMQKNAYEDYLRRYGKRSSNAGAIGSLIGGGLGAATGAMTGTPYGVATGYQMGSGLGGAAGYGFGGY